MMDIARLISNLHGWWNDTLGCLEDFGEYAITIHLTVHCFAFVFSCLFNKKIRRIWRKVFYRESMLFVFDIALYTLLTGIRCLEDKILTTPFDKERIIAIQLVYINLVVIISGFIIRLVCPARFKRS